MLINNPHRESDAAPSTGRTPVFENDIVYRSELVSHSSAPHRFFCVSQHPRTHDCGSESLNPSILRKLLVDHEEEEK